MYRMSVYGCFQSAHFPDITIGRHTFCNPPFPMKIHSMHSVKVRPLNLRSCKYLLRPYIPGKSENVTTTKRPRFHPSDPRACPSLPLKIIGLVASVVEHWIIKNKKKKRTLAFKPRKGKREKRRGRRRWMLVYIFILPRGSLERVAYRWEHWIVNHAAVDCQPQRRNCERAASDISRKDDNALGRLAFVHHSGRVWCSCVCARNQN